MSAEIAFAMRAGGCARMRSQSASTSGPTSTRSAPGALVVGNPEQVVEKILAQISAGDLPHDRVLRAIELLRAEVAPAVRAEVG
ncbi:MAG TPA: hypothetical protein VJ986_10630 [Gaiellaceae bacterium]|nr:hypothetical protein [Gaiellaceae bacterium]